jgi:maleate isomerase
MARLGIITPASNTNVEPATYAMLAGVPGTTAHFSRFALPPALDVTIGPETLAPAASLLAEAAVDVLAFHGTAGSWTGLDGDRALCAELARATGIPATTASLATVSALHALGARTLALVFPGEQWITDDIASEYAREGLEIVHVSRTERYGSNLEIGRASPRDVEALVRAGIVEGIDAVVVVGTNLAAAALVEPLERAHGVTIVDSTAATTWELLRSAGVEARLDGWGRLLAATDQWASPPLR